MIAADLEVMLNAYLGALFFVDEPNKKAVLETVTHHILIWMMGPFTLSVNTQVNSQLFCICSLRDGNHT